MDCTGEGLSLLLPLQLVSDSDSPGMGELSVLQVHDTGSLRAVESLGIPKESLGIPKESLGNP